jgi:hypothetical protein
VSGYERLAFIPFTDNFDKNHSVSVVRAKATAILPDKVVLDRVHEGGSNEMPYEYLVITTGTTLPPPGKYIYLVSLLKGIYSLSLVSRVTEDRDQDRRGCIFPKASKAGF